MILTQLVETANKQLDKLVKSQNGTVSLGQLWKIWSDNKIATVMVSTLVGLVVIPVGLVVACSDLNCVRTSWPDNDDVRSYMINKGAYLRRCSVWINGSRVEVFTCLGLRDERGRVKYIERDGGRATAGYTIWQPGRTKDCLVHYKDRNYAICLYD